MVGEVSQLHLLARFVSRLKHLSGPGVPQLGLHHGSSSPGFDDKSVGHLPRFSFVHNHGAGVDLPGGYSRHAEPFFANSYVHWRTAARAAWVPGRSCRRTSQTLPAVFHSQCPWGWKDFTGAVVT